MDLPGVGPKTAAVVLLFAFNMPLLPVDTHVNRLSRRLGFVPVEASLEEAERILEMITPGTSTAPFTSTSSGTAGPSAARGLPFAMAAS